MDMPSENDGSLSRLPVLAQVSLFVGGILTAAMSVVLFLAVVLNVSPLYRAELRSIDIIVATFGGATTTGVLFAAIWVPIVICLAAFAIVIAGVAIVIWTTWVQDLLDFIQRQSAICRTLPWWRRSFCWAAVAGAVSILTAALGLFFTAAAVVLINIIVVVVAAF